MLISILKVIFMLGTLIVIHEFGHFIVAKACGMKVNKFSIGFGPKILKKQGKETEYSLRLFPLGGFVQLEDEEMEEEETENEGKNPTNRVVDPRSFQQKPAWQRLLVMLAGVTVNIIFAIVVYVAVNMSLNTYLTPKVTEVSQENLTPYLQAGEEILRINDKKVYNAIDVSYRIAEAKDDEFDFEIINKNGEVENRMIVIPEVSVGYIGVSFADTVVYSVLKESAGERAGLQAGDKILAINGIENQTIESYLAIIQSSPNENLEILVNRNDEDIVLEVMPEAIQKRNFNVNFTVVKDLNFGENLYYAWKETQYFLRGTLEGYQKLLTGKTENVEMQGIVGISQQISNTEKAVDFFALMSAISLSLGIMNLLPIPGLDGGKILFTLVEVVRRKPINRETEGKLTLAGFALLLFFMVIVTVKDVVNLF